MKFWKLFLFSAWIVYALHIAKTNLAGMTLFDPHSEVYTFYHILIAFDRSAIAIYAIHILAVVVECLSFIPLCLFIFQKKFLSPHVWQWLFVIRIPLNILGCYYDMISLKSLFVSDLPTGIIVLFSMIITYLPSYIACFQYAFRQERLLLN